MPDQQNSAQKTCRSSYGLRAFLSQKLLVISEKISTTSRRSWSKLYQMVNQPSIELIKKSLKLMWILKWLESSIEINSVNATSKRRIRLLELRRFFQLFLLLETLLQQSRLTAFSTLFYPRRSKRLINLSDLQQIHGNQVEFLL